MSAEAPAFSRAEKAALAVKAVNRLIADVEAKRLLEKADHIERTAKLKKQLERAKKLRKGGSL